MDLEVNQGDIVAIMGSSGSGKSTLLSILAGLEPPTTGQIALLNQPLQGKTEDALALFRRQHVGFIFQDFQLIPTLTALENVTLPLQLKGNYDEAAARGLLDKLGMSHRLSHYPNQLSGGEQQRVAVARAFVHNPPLVFADEPTGNLDEATGDKVIELLFAVREQTQATLIIVTHDRSLAERCDRQLQLRHGLLADVGVVNAAMVDANAVEGGVPNGDE